MFFEVQGRNTGGCWAEDFEELRHSHTTSSSDGHGANRWNHSVDVQEEQRLVSESKARSHFHAGLCGQAAWKSKVALSGLLTLIDLLQYPCSDFLL